MLGAEDNASGDLSPESRTEEIFRYDYKLKLLYEYV